MASRKKFLLRISLKLYEELEAWAQEDLRSVNGQIEFLLTQMVRKRRSGRDTMGETGPSSPPKAEVDGAVDPVDPGPAQSEGDRPGDDELDLTQD